MKRGEEKDLNKEKREWQKGVEKYRSKEKRQ